MGPVSGLIVHAIDRSSAPGRGGSPAATRPTWPAASPNPFPPESFAPWSSGSVWSGGYIASLDMRGHRDNSPGRALTVRRVTPPGT